MVTNTGIPEIIQQIGTHLDPPHLYTAVRVCRSWNHALVPFLWTSIDDSLYSWARILDTFMERRRMDSNDVSGGDWVRGVFLKYGHLVQHLHVQRREVLDAVCVTRTCVELKTFRVGKVEPVRLRLLEHEWMYDLSEEEQVEMAEIRWKDAMEGYVDSLTFRHAFNPRSLDLSKTTLAQMEVNWEVTRGFWMLLRENQELQVLRLDESLEFMYAVSNEYFLGTLASLKDLNDLENDFMQVDLAAVLQVVPDLRRYARLTNPSGPLSLTQPVRRLTHVELNKPTSCQELLQFLRDSPNLESLSIHSLCNAPLFNANDAEALMSDSPSQLQRLQIRMLMSTDGSLLDTVLPWIPDLRTIHLTQFCSSHARPFMEHCSALTTIEGSNVGSIARTTPGRLQENHETGALERMIMTCPTLKKIDWIGKTLRGKSLWDYAGVWPSLTYLRCQIGGLRVRTARYEGIWKHNKDFHDPFQILEQSVLEERELIRQQQRLVLSRIGSLRNLKTLDIGADFQLHENKNTTRNGGQGGSWVHKERPRMHDCLRLSLEMGLDELAGLKDIEVFGFEGIEHEIGEAELRWMNKTWKKLRVMRGLCGSGELSLWEEMSGDFRKEPLLGFMKRLRPDVVHEPSSVCIMMPLA